METMGESAANPGKAVEMDTTTETEPEDEEDEMDTPQNSSINQSTGAPNGESHDEASQLINQATPAAHTEVSTPAIDQSTEALYSEVDSAKNFHLAVTAVQTGGMKVKEAAEKYGVSKAGLKRLLQQLEEDDSKAAGAGRPKFFRKRDETLLYQMLKCISDLRQPFAKELFLEVAKKLAEKRGHPDHNFGNSWIQGFIKRHCDLKLRKRSAKDKQLKWTKEKCDVFIEAMTSLETEGPSDPRTIFALTSLEMVAPTQDKNAKKLITPTRKKKRNGTEKGFSVIACGGADGSALRAMMLREGNVILEPWFVEVNEEVVIGTNNVGVFDAESIGLYIKFELIPYIKSLDPPASKSVLLVDDRWHLLYDMDIMESAIKNNLIILPFPIGHCDKVQPLDQQEFKLFTRIWLEFVGERDRPLNEFVRTNTLARTLMASKRRQDMSTSIRSGFQSKGICPFDASRIRSTVLSPGRVVLPLKVSTTLYEPFFKRFESYATLLGVDCGMPENLMQSAMEAFKQSVIASGLQAQPGSRPIQSFVLPSDPSSYEPPFSS
ncbi:hypothetical protein BV898_06122 [Hypsibius exemplaris]|uniref:HTH CENPB-type domain-containing protein n=1 Tax=Hypsibius exemplaris TaxID=2072580 RepID=A0A1W0WXH8_HYPEX|nr:hypothetical protein BV898_06122 [Hypsibius exemplaris]